MSKQDEDVQMLDTLVKACTPGSETRASQDEEIAQLDAIVTANTPVSGKRPSQDEDVKMLDALVATNTNEEKYTVKSKKGESKAAPYFISTSGKTTISTKSGKTTISTESGKTIFLTERVPEKTMKAWQEESEKKEEKRRLEEKKEKEIDDIISDESSSAESWNIDQVMEKKPNATTVTYIPGFQTGQRRKVSVHKVASIIPSGTKEIIEGVVEKINMLLDPIQAFTGLVQELWLRKTESRESGNFISKELLARFRPKKNKKSLEKERMTNNSQLLNNKALTTFVVNKGSNMTVIERLKLMEENTDKAKLKRGLLST